jgi:DNA-directed RNA polymerase beta' subunit
MDDLKSKHKDNDDKPDHNSPQPLVESQIHFIRRMCIERMHPNVKKSHFKDIQDGVDGLDTLDRLLQILGRVEKQRLDNLLDPLVQELRGVSLKPSMFDEFVEKIVDEFYISHVSAGEMVGITCAQSIGERQTQMSVVYHEIIHIRELCVATGTLLRTFVGPIGEFIDTWMKTLAPLVQKDPVHTKSDILPWDSTRNVQLWISSINQNDGSVAWCRIRELSRHPPHGPVQIVRTETGKEVCTTLSHSLLVPNIVAMTIGCEKEKINLDASTPLQPLVAADIEVGKHYLPVFHISRKGAKKEMMVSSSSSLGSSGSWEKVTSVEILETLPGTSPYVYDFSVESHETFLLQSGIYVHNTLNTFHSAGLAVQTVLSGVPRFMEILNATKEPRFSSSSFSLRNTKNISTTITSISDIRNIVQHHLVSLTMQDIIDNWDVFLTPPEEIWYDAFEMIYGDRFRDMERGLRLRFDPMRMYHYRIGLDDIGRYLESRFDDIICVFSPQHMNQMDIFVDTSLLSPPEPPTELIDATNYEAYFLEKVLLQKIGEMVLCGISGVKDYVVQKVGDKFSIITQGNNFQEIMGLDWIDPSTVYSNNMWDIYRVLGIEAVRAFLVEELKRVISSDGTFIHPCHMTLLIDFMTYQGMIISVSRYGMKKEQSSPLAKASFEECLDHFLTAGFMGDEENIVGVSASIICGKRSNIGTGLCKLMFDPPIKAAGK